MAIELRIAHAEERPAQHADHGRSVVGIGEGLEEIGEPGDRGGLGEGGADPLTSTGRRWRLEGARVEGQAPSARGSG